MATRAIIRIEGISFAEIYKHWDGNPDSTLPWLEAFNSDFESKRHNDPEYKFAQLLRSSVRDADEYNLDENIHTGWGVCPYESDMGQEYTYTLMTDGSVVVDSFGEDD